MVSKLTICLAVACVIATAQAYSGGAPADVCEDMIPKHPAQPQRSAMPYTVKVSKDSATAGDTIKITLSGKEGFKGFLIQVRQGRKNIPTGKFIVADKDKYVKTINCGEGQQVIFEMFRQFIEFLVPDFKRFFPVNMLQNAATHKNSELKNNLSIDWQVPADLKGTVKVV